MSTSRAEALCCALNTGQCWRGWPDFRFFRGSSRGGGFSKLVCLEPGTREGDVEGDIRRLDDRVVVDLGC